MYWTNLGLLIVLDEWSGITRVITIHPEEDMNECTKFYSNPSYRRDISLKIKNVDLLVALQEKSGDHQVGRIYKILWQSIKQSLRYF